MAAGGALRQRGYEERPERQQKPKPAATKNKVKILITNMDYTIYLVVAILTFTGIVMVFSSSYLTTATDAKFSNDPFFFLRRTAMWAVFGFVAMNVMAAVPYKIVKNFSYMFYVVTVGLLVAVAAFGFAAGGAQRWLDDIPVVGQFQPSELAKAAIVFFLSALISDNPEYLHKTRNFFIASGAVLLPTALIGLNSMSSAIIIAVIGFGMIFIASPHILRFVAVGLMGGGGVAGYLWYVMKNMENVTGGWRGGRVAAWIDPFSDPLNYGFQVINSLYAIGSGGLFGLGIGQSRQTTFLPEAHNDMVFAIICEELGLVGAGIILLLFGILIWRGIRVAVNAPDTFGSMAAAGIVLTIASQVIINVAVVTNTIPNTGVTMPFISYGGTSLLVCMALSGVLLNISRHTRE